MSKVIKVYTIRLTQAQVAKIVEALIKAAEFKLAQEVLKRASK